MPISSTPGTEGGCSLYRRLSGRCWPLLGLGLQHWIDDTFPWTSSRHSCCLSIVWSYQLEIKRFCWYVSKKLFTQIIKTSPEHGSEGCQKKEESFGFMEGYKSIRGIYFGLGFNLMVQSEVIQINHGLSSQSYIELCHQFQPSSESQLRPDRWSSNILASLTSKIRLALSFVSVDIYCPRFAHLRNREKTKNLNQLFSIFLNLLSFSLTSPTSFSYLSRCHWGFCWSWSYLTLNRHLSFRIFWWSSRSCRCCRIRGYQRHLSTFLTCSAFHSFCLWAG